MTSRLFPVLLFAATLASATPARAAENRYDLLAKSLGPVAALFVPTAPNRAMRAELTLEKLTGAPDGALGIPVAVALQPPDRLRIEAEIAGEPITICRDEQHVWAAPGSKFEIVLGLLGPLPEPVPGFRLGKFTIPVPPEQIALFPMLFKIQERPAEAIDGVDCRVLDLELIPEIENQLKRKDWTATLWVAPDRTPAKIRLARPGFEAVVRVRGVEYFPTIADAEWRPPVGGTDVLMFDADRMSQLMRIVERVLGGR